MTDVLIYADSMGNAAMRHEVPVPVPDPFLYVEKDGERHAVVTSFESSRIEPVGIKAHPLEEFDYDGAVAIAVAMLAISFVLLLLINLIQVWSRRHSAGA